MGYRYVAFVCTDKDDSLTRISYYPLSHTNSRVPIASEDMHKDDMPMGDGRFARVVLFAVCG